MQKLKVIAITLALFASVDVHAATYQWRDNNGGIHFTDNADSIPDRYLKSAKELPSIRVEKKSQPVVSPVPPSANPPAANPVAANPPAVSPPAANTPAVISSKQGNGDAKPAKRPDERETLTQELKAIQEALPKKKEELGKLHHKWVVRKGRMPSDKELKEYGEKQAKRKVPVEDVKENPYVNKNSLTAVGPARAAYYKKLEEIQNDEARVRQLEKDLQAIH